MSKLILNFSAKFRHSSNDFALEEFKHQKYIDMFKIFCIKGPSDIKINNLMVVYIVKY